MVMVLRVLTFYWIFIQRLGVVRDQSGYYRRWADLHADRLAILCRSGFFRWERLCITMLCR